MDFYSTSVINTSGDIFKDYLWSLETGTTPTNTTPTTIPDNGGAMDVFGVDLRPDSFNRYVDNVSSDADSDLQAHLHLCLDDIDWSTMFLPIPSSSPPSTAYSGGAAFGTLPASPCMSTASEDTAVDPLSATYPDFGDGQQKLPAAEPPLPINNTTLGLRGYAVTYPSLPEPYACPSSQVDIASGQQQQHPPSDAAASVSGSASTPTVGLIAPLTSQAGAPTTVSEGLAASGSCPGAERRTTDDAATKPAKRRKPQSTEKTLTCPRCGLRSAREFNLNKHIKAVHEGIKEHQCPHPDCDVRSSRKHDIKRHFISSHTDLGSPRRKAGKE